MSRTVKRVYRVTADPVKETEQFKTELERTLNQIMEEEDSDADISVTLATSVNDKTSNRAIGTVYQNTSGLLKVIQITVNIT